MPGPKKKGKGKKKVRVAFRRNRSKPRRNKDWTESANQDESQDIVAAGKETVKGKGDVSRHRTIVIQDDLETRAQDLKTGTVIAMRGLFVEVDDGERIWNCTVRRILRTRLIEERHPVTIGDRVHFSVDESGDEAEREGVIEVVDPRKGQLRRKAGRRVQIIAANVDQALIVNSAAEPDPKPNLIDRYIISTLAGDITPIICINKLDLDQDGYAQHLLERYADLGYTTLGTSTVSGQGREELAELCHNKATVIAGQSGVGKSSMLNMIQPGLSLRVGRVGHQNQKGRHTTTTAELIKLESGGYVVDTPGIRSFDLTIVPRHQYEAYFTEFVEFIAHCKYPDCTHIHENDCALKQAVEEGFVHIERYRSYVQVFEDPGVIQ
ncbi:MAG: ribosome small subunit-dependent GTPase A [Phycisphaerae bacterium]